MPKLVFKVGDQKTFLVCLLCIWCQSTWRYDNYVKHQGHSKWCHDNYVKNQGTNAIVIALILLSLDPDVKSGLHNMGIIITRYCINIAVSTNFQYDSYWVTLGGQYVNYIQMSAINYIDYNVLFIICLLHCKVKYK